MMDIQWLFCSFSCDCLVKFVWNVNFSDIKLKHSYTPPPLHRSSAVLVSTPLSRACRIRWRTCWQCSRTLLLSRGSYCFHTRHAHRQVCLWVTWDAWECPRGTGRRHMGKPLLGWNREWCLRGWIQVRRAVAAPQSQTASYLLNCSHLTSCGGSLYQKLLSSMNRWTVLSGLWYGFRFSTNTLSFRPHITRWCNKSASRVF